MGKEGGYGQFCPVAKAAEIVTTRWTPLVLRELISGSRRFNEIHRGVPLMSRALLAKRLRDLEHAGVIERTSPKGTAFSEYHLTRSGEELRPIIVALGVWGQRWVEVSIDSVEWDAGVLMWDIRHRVDPTAMLPGRTVIQFEYADAPKELRLWWLVVEADDVDLCQSDPGHEVDLYVSTDVRTMARVWIGKDSLDKALESDRIEVIGNTTLRKTLATWLRLAVVAEAVRHLEAPGAA